MSRIEVTLAGALVSAQLFLLCANGRAQQASPAASPQPILPAAPTVLLACLPAAPPGWTMTRSNAAATFFEWLTASANRDFKQGPPPANPNAAPTLPFVPGTLSVHLTDNGFYTNFAPGFAPSADGSTPKNVAFLKIGQYPARRDRPDDATLVLSLLVKGRFLVELRAKNLLDKDLMDCVARVDYPRLLAIPDTGPHNVPQPVMVTRIDELDPKQNRSYPVYWSRADQVGLH